jgi:hypothetical protein
MTLLSQHLRNVYLNGLALVVIVLAILELGHSAFKTRSANRKGHRNF